ncbi:ubiquitin-protein ligase [Flagelloscypha sp. PMI_526]|nr:ubiquitin-protein ligase [Flagelloscypha sp. PMI_526]
MIHPVARNRQRRKRSHVIVPSSTFLAATMTTQDLSKIPARGAGVEEIWSFLRCGVNVIMNDLEGGMSTNHIVLYTNMHTTVYNYCTSTRRRSNSVHNRTGANLVGSELYNKLSEYFVAYFHPITEQAAALQDEELLQFYSARWDYYTRCAKYLNNIFTYLNRDWVTRERDEGRKNVLPVYTLALVQWRNEFFMHVQGPQKKLTNALLRLVEQQRNGEVIDQVLIKKVVYSFVSLGIDRNDLNKECLDVYKEHFEEPFIQATELYYKKESENFLAVNSISDYLQKAEQRLREEEDRVERYLHTNTLKELVSKCEQIINREHSESTRQLFQKYLDCNQDDGLQCMHTLLSHIPKCLDSVRETFQAHVKDAGLSAIDSLVSQGDGGTTNTDSLDLKSYVDALLAVHRKKLEMVTRLFKSDAGFIASLDKACGEFINKNGAPGSSSLAGSPELIAKYVDGLLRRNNKKAEDGDVEAALSRAILLFKYLKDKDIFQAFYTTGLAKRLIHGLTASDEAEAFMISKLKEVCGFEYTNKLQRMLSDVSLSKDFTDSFRERMERNHGSINISFSVMVLGTSVWPLKPPTHDYIIPQEILPTYNLFFKYYKDKHFGRKLTWLWNYSKNELRTNYLNQRYMLMTSSYQMAILLQYNRNDTLSLDELVSATSIPKHILTHVLALLTKAKVLVSSEGGQIDLNLSFKSKKVRINLNQPIKADTDASDKIVLKAVDEDRKFLAQATIVRIMKARKTIKSQALIQEVISQTSLRFNPKISDIKKAIDMLIEREYIERAEEGTDTFAYVAC